MIFSPNAEQTQSSKGDGRRDAAFQLIIALAVGIFVTAALLRQAPDTAEFWLSLVASSSGAYLLEYWFKNEWLTPAGQPDVMVDDPGALTDSITTSGRSAYAISSNWLSLWRSSTFRYYLHLDAAMSLTAYSSGIVSPLERLSHDRRDQKKFFDEGWELVRRIGDGFIPRRKHRLRLLIYPQWAYSAYYSEVMHLIRSHSAARIPCIPLVAEKVWESLAPDEAKRVEDLVGDLRQRPLDKIPPLSKYEAWKLARRTKKGEDEILTFPDVLVIDAPFASGGVWWYDTDGEVDHWDSQHDAKRAQALEVFQTICKHAHPSVSWAHYAENNLGGVVMAAAPKRLESEAFFARRYYGNWLTWIRENADNDNAARELRRWLREETKAMQSAIDHYSTVRGGPNHELELLDIGCGFGRHLVDLLKENGAWSGVGIDINLSMVDEATKLAKEEGTHYRSSFMSTDAALLGGCDPDEFDYAICMTNTLGNLTTQKQEQLIRRLRRVLKPGGRIFISTYTDGANLVRMASYRAVGLDVEVEGDRIVAAEGLESEAFSPAKLRGLIEDNGMRLTKPIEPFAGIGLLAVAERPR